MYWATLITILVELLFVVYQAFRYLYRLEDKKRHWYFFLLLLLLIHNILLGLFLDTNLNISVERQHMLRYGEVLIVASYCTFYFHKSFAGSSLKFHVKWCIWLFLMSPYIFVLGSFYFLTNPINLSVTYGIAAPILYLFFLVYATGKTVYSKYKKELLYKFKDVALLFIALLPWGLIAFMVALGITQIQELILTNTGFLLLCLFYVKEDHIGRVKETHIQPVSDVIVEKDVQILPTPHLPVSKTNVEPNNNNSEKAEDFIANHDHRNTFFEENCNTYLTKVQIDVIKMVNEGFTYKEVAQIREVSEDYIKEVMGDIGKLLEVRRKDKILKKLKSSLLKL